MKKPKRILSIQQVCLGDCKHDVIVTHIAGEYNIRILTNDVVNQEVRVTKKIQISPTIAEMLRTEDKCGNWSNLASASRDRNYCKKEA
jgi:hypothetical protein